MDSYELYASSASSNLPSNTQHDFYIQLNRTLVLNENSTLEVSAWSYDSEKKKSRKILYLFTDVTENTFFHGSEQPVVAAIYTSNRKSDHCYIPNPTKCKTVCGSINRLRRYIRDGKLSDSSVDFTDLTVTLRFRNVCVK